MQHYDIANKPITVIAAIAADNTKRLTLELS